MSLHSEQNAGSAAICLGAYRADPAGGRGAGFCSLENCEAGDDRAIGQMRGAFYVILFEFRNG